MSTRRRMVDATARHQVFLQRHAGTHSQLLRSFVGSLAGYATLKLTNAPNILSRDRYIRLIKELNQYSQTLTDEMTTTISNSLTLLAIYEADFTKRLLDKSSTLGSPSVPIETVIPSDAQLKAAALTNVMDARLGETVEGLTVGGVLEKYGSKVAATIVQRIRQGYAAGVPTNEIASDIEDYAGSSITRLQATSLARTMTNYIANVAKDEFYTANDDIITSYQFVATLDSRTTLQCGALDGQVFDKGSFPYPPIHYNCRSTYIAVVDPKYSYSSPSAVRPSKGDSGTEQVAPTSTYNSWLKRQSDAFQDEVLGPGRAELFRGGASVQSFVDHNYEPINLDQLRAKDDDHS